MLIFSGAGGAYINSSSPSELQGSKPGKATSPDSAMVCSTKRNKWTSCSPWPPPFASAKPASQCILLKQKVVTCGIYLAVSGSPPLSPSPFLCERCHRINPQKSQTEHVLQRGNTGGLTPLHKRRRPRGGAVSTEQWVHMVWQWGCRVVGANDLSGFLLPAAPHSHTERGVRNRGVVKGEQLVSFTGGGHQGSETISHDSAGKVAIILSGGICVGSSHFQIPISWSRMTYKCVHKNWGWGQRGCTGPRMESDRPPTRVRRW